MNRNPENKYLLDETRKDLEEFIDIKTKLIKLEIAERSAKTAGELVFLFILLIFSFIIVCLMVLLSGLFLSNYFGSMITGFGIVTGAIVFLFLLLLLFRKQWITTPVMNKVIKLLFEDYE